MTEHFEFVIEPEDVGSRLDTYLSARETPSRTRSQVRRSLDLGEILVDGDRVKAGYKLRLEQRITWALAPPAVFDLEPEDLGLVLLHDDEHLAIVDKPHGLVVHPSLGHTSGTLVHGLLHLFKDLPGDPVRPGIVHRIDKDTSGALVISKTDAAHQHLSEKFRTHDIERVYHAIVLDHGIPTQGTFTTLHGRDSSHRMRFSSRVSKGKEAVTHWRVLERFEHNAALVACKLETGRTHQIRMHFYDAKSPLLGDSLYGGRATSNASIISRQALHARTLGFENLDGSELHITSPYPADFERALTSLRAGHDWR